MSVSNLSAQPSHTRGGDTNHLRLKVFLQDRKSRLYFQGLEKWTHNRDEALNFQHSAKASGVVMQTKLPNMDIIMSLSESKYDLRIPCSLSA
jgi:hypothetical protein